jgi:hypothetical protein
MPTVEQVVHREHRPPGGRALAHVVGHQRRAVAVRAQLTDVLDDVEVDVERRQQGLHRGEVEGLAGDLGHGVDLDEPLVDGDLAPFEAVPGVVGVLVVRADEQLEVALGRRGEGGPRRCGEHAGEVVEHRLDRRVGRGRRVPGLCHGSSIAGAVAACENRPVRQPR